MNFFQIGIIVLGVLVLGIFFFDSKRNKRIRLGHLANYLSVYGVVCGILIYFDLAPRLVKFEKVRELQITSFDAFEKVSRDGRNRASFFEYPDFYFSMYLYNSGTLPISNPVLLFKFDKEQTGFNYLENMSAYVIEGPNNGIKNPGSFSWKSPASGNHDIKKSAGGDLYEISLPPILPNQLTSILVGFKASYQDFSNGIESSLDSLITGTIQIKIVDQLTTSPLRDKINPQDVNSYSELKKIDILDSITAQFRLVNHSNFNSFPTSSR